MTAGGEPLAYLEWLRARVGHAPVILVYATAMIRDGEGRILFQRRGDFPIWGLPGGLLEPGETIAQTLVREAREETGFDVAPVRFIGLYSSPDYMVHYRNGDEVQQVTAFFDCRITGGDGRPDGTESLSQEFRPIAAAPPMFPWYEQMLRDAAAVTPHGVTPNGGAPNGATRFDAGSATGANPYPGGLVRFIRSKVGREPILLPCACAVILDERRRVALIRRSDTGHWGQPCGAMELGERIDVTVAREVLEETGLEVRPERLTGFYAGPKQFNQYPNGDQVWLATAVFLCRITAGAPRPDGVETTDVRFFDLDALPFENNPWGERTRQRIRDALEGAAEAAIE
jgi:ADP-ribose pyrophosphatase YjhB (NUDIX family)